MSCQIIIMDLDGNHVFGVDEVVDVVASGTNLGVKIYNNPRFKIIQSDMPLEEAQVLLTPEYDIFMNAIKPRDKTLFTRDLLHREINMNRSEVISRVINKELETFEQTEDVVVG